MAFWTIIIGSPAAIAWFVALVVINPVESHTFRPLAHVSKKIIEDQPAFANRNASASVPSPLPRFRIQASLLHAGPRIVSWRGTGFVHGGVAMAGLSDSFALETSATGCVAARQIIADSDDFVSAIAETNPARIGRLRVRKSQNGKATEAQSGEISEGGHGEFHV
jgi:hypothetical protein